MRPLLSLLLARVLSESLRSSARRREARRRLAPRRPQLDILEDRSLPSAYMVTTTADSGPGSLRDAITQVNADTSHALYASPSNPSVDEIDFAITSGSDTGGGFNAGTGVATITPHSALPNITNAVTIDGTTQPGYTASPLIELQGHNAGSTVNGITVASGGAGSVIKGLVIDGFSGNGIELDASNCTVAADYIGINPAGTAASANGGNGVLVYIADNETFGGTTPAARNVISGNAGDGIRIMFTAGDVIQGNYLGTNAAGTAAVGNAAYGVDSYGASNVTLGGLTATPGTGPGNVISGNSAGVIIGQGGWLVQGNLIGTTAEGNAALGNQLFGLRVDGGYGANNTIGGTAVGSANVIAGTGYDGVVLSSANHNVVVGNYIGTNSAGANLGNGRDGIIIGGGANNNLIGSIGSGAGNVIAFNGAVGVGIGVSYDTTPGLIGNSVRGNSMHDNGGIGIDLNTDGITLNGSHTGSGPNNWQHFPVLSATQVDGSGNLLVTYSVDSTTASSAYPLTVDFYATDAYGEGKTYLASDTWTTADLANGQKMISLGSAAALGLTASTALVATATDASGNTSEFSASQSNRATFQVTNTSDSGAGSLRQAILDANFHAGQDTITFNIPSSGVQTIHLLSALPGMVEGITIDGTSQPGYGGSPLIELQGSGAGAGTNGLTVGRAGRSGAGSVIKGLVINGFSGNGIELDASNCTVAADYIGINPAGTAASANGGNGVLVYIADNETFGGTTPAARNVISGNAGDGIRIMFTAGDVIQGNYLGTNAAGTAAVGNAGYGIDSYGASIITLGGLTATPGAGPGNVISGNGDGAIMGSNWLVQGNLVGTNAAGTAALGNHEFGLRIGAGANTTIGGTAAGAANVIGGNGTDGVLVSDGASGSVVAGNYVGTNSAGATNLGNSRNGIVIYAGANNNLIGGSGTGAGNVIAFNGAVGVVLGGAGDSGVVNNAILGNSIHDNGGIGIDLGSGANNNQAAPVLTSVQSGLGLTIITGTITSVPSATIRVEFFANAAGDPEGRTLLGSQSITTDGSGHGSFAAVLSAALPAGQSLVTATATDPGGNTSPFSVGLTATPLPPSSLCGVVFKDFNEDGFQDFGELGLGSVSVQLTGTDFIGQAVSLSAASAASGYYQFPNLLPGSYTVSVPGSLTVTKIAVGLNGSPAAVVGSGNSSPGLAIALGTTLNEVTFGVEPAAGDALHRGQTAGIGFWNNKNGQALLKALNGGGTAGSATQMGSWLSDTLPNMFGSAGANLAGKNNAQVAAYFQVLFATRGDKLEAQVLATALSVYVTNSTLAGGSYATSYGFTVVAGGGTGLATYNIGSDGAAVGHANGTTMTIMDILLAADQHASHNATAAGFALYAGDQADRSLADDLFGHINDTGGI